MTYNLFGFQVSQVVFWAVVPALLTLAASTVVAWLLYRRSQRVARPRYALERWPLIGDLGPQFEQLEVRYAGSRVPRVSVGVFILWNAGRGTIRADDIASTDPIVVSVPDGVRILDAQVQWANEVTNRFSVSVDKDQRRASIGFEFIDGGQGAVVRVLHTGPPVAPELCGTIKGAGRFTKVGGRERAEVAVVLGPLGLVALCVYVTAQVLPHAATAPSAVGVLAVVLPMAAFGVFGFIANLRDRRDPIPRSIRRHL